MCSSDLRALRILGEVGLIAAEDTRTTRKLLTKHGIQAKLVSYHKFSGDDRLQALTEALATQDIALVTDAGMPVVSDPGYELVLSAARAGITVVPIPGPSAMVTALAVSGLPSEQVVFTGFLPRKPTERRRALADLQTEAKTLVCFEAPHRLRKTLADLAELLPGRPLAVCRELTKLHEEVYRGYPADALEHFAEPRGEITMVIGGCGLPTTGYWQPERAPEPEPVSVGRYRRVKPPRPGRPAPQEEPEAE